LDQISHLFQKQLSQKVNAMAPTWEYSVMLLQSDAKEESVQALEYALSQCNTISTDKTRVVHLSRSVLEGQEMPPDLMIEKKGKKGKQQSATMAALLQHWIENDEKEGLKKKVERGDFDMSDAISVASGNGSVSNHSGPNSVRSGKGKGDSVASPQKKTTPAQQKNGPDVVYILSDFPTSVDEAEQLLKLEGAVSSLLDGVLQLVWRPGSKIETPVDKDKVVLGGCLPQVAAFNKLPHLEQAREAAAASRAAAAKKSNIHHGHHSSHHSSSHHSSSLAAGAASGGGGGSGGGASSIHSTSSSVAHSSVASHSLASAMHDDFAETTSILDELESASLADDLDKYNHDDMNHVKGGGGGRAADVAGLEVRRKSFELPAPQSRAPPPTKPKTTSSSSSSASSAAAAALAQANSSTQSSNFKQIKGGNALVEKLIEATEKNVGMVEWTDVSFDEVAMIRS
jgi:hypothetical protein